MAFAHEKLTVYQRSLDFMVFMHKTTNAMPPGWANLKDQALRAASSIVLNIAEGTGKFYPKDKRRYYRSSAGSAAECSAVLDVMFRVEVVDVERLEEGKKIVDHVAAMLANLIKSLNCGDDE